MVALKPDVTFNTMLMVTGGMAELGIGIIVSCLPVLPRFFQHIGPKLHRGISCCHAVSDKTKSGWKRLGSFVRRTSPDEKYDDRSQSIALAFSAGSDPMDEELRAIHDMADSKGLTALEEGLSKSPLSKHKNTACGTSPGQHGMVTSSPENHEYITALPPVHHWKLDLNLNL